MANGVWIVRVKRNKVSVGIFACSSDDLIHLVDEVCDPNACEFKSMPPGGFVFGGTVVLHEIDEEQAEYAPVHIGDGYLTESWAEHAYDDDGTWWPFIIAEND
ncbi:hypothetical protein EDF58_1156 [Novosphingobium sp. PhB57]|nr:hypothetical protein EDF58_1156 [Novosphingobium sp. PhB57]